MPFDRFGQPIIQPSPDEDKWPCCKMLKIQPHSPSCDGEVRDERRRK